VQSSTPPTNWEISLQASCKTMTSSISRASAWPEMCNPDGMAQALMAFDPGVTWNEFTSLNTVTGQTDALNATVASLALYGSPAVVPIFGQADHWVTIYQIDATPLTTPGTFSISSLKAFDGGMATFADSGGHKYNTGPQLFSGITWQSIYSP